MTFLIPIEVTHLQIEQDQVIITPGVVGEAVTLLKAHQVTTGLGLHHSEIASVNVIDLLVGMMIVDDLLPIQRIVIPTLIRQDMIETTLLVIVHRRHLHITIAGLLLTTGVTDLTLIEIIETTAQAMTGGIIAVDETKALFLMTIALIMTIVITVIIVLLPTHATEKIALAHPSLLLDLIHHLRVGHVVNTLLFLHLRCHKFDHLLVLKSNTRNIKRQARRDTEAEVFTREHLLLLRLIIL